MPTLNQFTAARHIGGSAWCIAETKRDGTVRLVFQEASFPETSLRGIACFSSRAAARAAVPFLPGSGTRGRYRVVRVAYTFSWD